MLIATKETFQYGNHNVTLETGALARQATAAVKVTMGDTVLLATVVASKNSDPGKDFFPLTVNYQEKFYAAGRIPGGYLKREGRPSDRETLISRLIDRPLRPMFPEGFTNEVQIIVTLLSQDENIESDFLSIISASAALAISGIPFIAPVAAAKVGYHNGQYLLNPSAKELETSDLELVVAGTSKAVLMVESQAKELSENAMLGAVTFGHEQMQVAIKAINAFADKAGKTKWQWQPPEIDKELMDKIKSLAEKDIVEAYQIKEKPDRYGKLDKIREKVVTELCTEGGENLPSENLVKSIFADIEKKHVRREILAGKARIDGRDTKTVRPIAIEVGILPRTHGSALFTRGETQAIVVTTLGTERDAQMIDDVGSTDKRQNYMLHYNFPPFCVGEIGMIGSPKRRELGHGKLAKRGTQAIMPTVDSFPYTIRVVSEITESNGSSSMASVCGTSLSLMDAGVPIKAPVAGIAMGLIKEGDRFAVLSDILGDEDHLGDMDFKVAGTQNGITALQMDIKIDGITNEIMKTALEQAHEGRLHILNIMNQVINKPRVALSNYAPRIITLKIKPDRIRDVIGKGGATIKELTESTGTTIDISDDGIVKIYAVDAEKGKEAKERIEMLTAEAEIGRVYKGTVSKIMDFGAFVDILDGNKSGLVHISQISHERVNDVRDKLQEGQVIYVKVLEIDRQGKIRLSMKEVEQAMVS